MPAPSVHRMSRRGFLRRASHLGLAIPLLLDRRLDLRAGADTTGATVDPGAPEIRSRQGWGSDLAPTGALETEAPEDVRFLLVHHSGSTNDYPAEGVRELLRRFFAYHTDERGWPDIAYNFLVDRFGVVWEGRRGSLSAPVKGDATGGSQGFALSACWIGDHRDEPPSAAAQAAMVGLLAALATRYAIDPEGRTRFSSRGSNRHPRGVEVRTRTLAGHREMSRTVCPGDAGQRLVTDVLPGRVAAALDALAAQAGGEPSPSPSGAPGGAATETPGRDAGAPPGPGALASPAPASPAPGPERAPFAAPRPEPSAGPSAGPSGPAGPSEPEGDGEPGVGGGLAAGVAAAVLAAGGVAAARAARGRLDRT